MYLKPSFSAIYDKILEDIKLQILKDTPATIIGTSTDELAEYYFAKRHYTPIEIDSEKIETIEQKNEVRTVRSEQRDPMYRNDGDLQFEYESIHVTIPIIPHPNLNDLLNMRPSTFSLSGNTNKVSWKRNTAEFTIDTKGYGFTRDEKWIVNEVTQLKQYVYNHIHIVKTEIEAENAKLLPQIKVHIERRKAKLTEDKEKYNSLFKQIGIPLKKKNDEVVKRIQLDTKPLVQRIKPNPTQPENYIIDRAKVLDIIHILDNQGIQFEKTPASFENAARMILETYCLLG